MIETVQPPETAAPAAPGPASANTGEGPGCLAMVPVVLSFVLLAAHSMRAGEPGLIMMWMSAPLILWIGRRWAALGLAGLLAAGAAVWISTAWQIGQTRVALGEPWTRMALIMGGVALFTAASALVFLTKTMRDYYRSEPAILPPAAAMIVTAIMLGAVQLKVPIKPLILERLLPGGGWLEVLWLSIYAGWLTDKMLAPGGALRWRPRLWGAFSLVFFIQLVIGLAGFETFLMTGKLHLPVPALIVAGPIYRGHGFFMLILFGITLLLAGPAWCSHLCYIGAWDDQVARLKDPPKPLPGWRKHLRLAILIAAIAAALILRYLGAGDAAVMLAAAFGVGGLAVMLIFSTRAGTMVHCTSYCPIGWVSCHLGKISPFRVRISDSCTRCGACSRVCRYDALHKEDIEAKRPGESCTLCGDCTAACKHNAIAYRFPGLSPDRARALFIVVVVILHAVFLGAARI